MWKKKTVKIIKLLQDAIVPTTATEGSAGLDIYAYLKTDNVEQTIKLRPGERALISTGISLEIPYGFEVQIRSRSGLAFKEGIFVLNSPGTVDSDYTGEIKVILHNSGNTMVSIEHGQRIAQMVIARVYTDELYKPKVETLIREVRGSGGCGSTGK